MRVHVLECCEHRQKERTQKQLRRDFTYHALKVAAASGGVCCLFVGGGQAVLGSRERESHGCLVAFSLSGGKCWVRLGVGWL